MLLRLVYDCLRCWTLMVRRVGFWIYLAKCGFLVSCTWILCCIMLHLFLMHFEVSCCCRFLHFYCYAWKRFRVASHLGLLCLCSCWSSFVVTMVLVPHSTIIISWFITIKLPLGQHRLEKVCKQLKLSLSFQTIFISYAMTQHVLSLTKYCTWRWQLNCHNHNILKCETLLLCVMSLLKSRDQILIRNPTNRDLWPNFMWPVEWTMLTTNWDNNVRCSTNRLFGNVGIRDFTWTKRTLYLKSYSSTYLWIGTLNMVFNLTNSKCLARY